MDAPPLLLAFVFGIHIAMVNLGIAFATLIPYLKYKGERSGDEEVLGLAKGLMRFYAYTYGLAGVFGTAFTVFLLSFYPEFLALAGHIALVPFGIAIMFIVLHFFSIVAYWYGWDRWSSGTHLAVGVLLAFSAYMIPLGFRAVFAFLNTPTGLSFQPVDGVKPYLSITAALSNPTFLPLYLKSIVGALTAGLLTISGGYAYMHLKGRGGRASENIMRQASVWGMLGLLAMAALGFWYTMSLMHVEYKFNNIFGGLGWRIGSGTVHYNYSWLFLAKMTLVGIQGVALLYVIHGMIYSRFPDPGRLKALILAGAASLATIVAGEFLNAFSQYPYFIADITDPKIVSGIPKPWRSIIASAADMSSSNPLARGGGLMMLTLGFLGALILAAVFLLYLLLTPPRTSGQA